MEQLRTDVVKGLGVKLLDRVLDIMQEEDEEKREVSEAEDSMVVSSSWKTETRDTVWFSGRIGWIQGFTYCHLAKIIAFRFSKNYKKLTKILF